MSSEVVMIKGLPYLRLSAAFGSGGTLNMHKGEQFFLLPSGEFPVAVGETLQFWHQIPFPKAFRPVSEIMQEVDLREKDGEEAIFPLSQNAIIRFTHNETIAEIPIEEAVIAMVKHLAEHPVLGLGRFFYDFRQPFEKKWNEALSQLSGQKLAA